MTLRGYARSRGYAPSTVHQAIATGRITRDADGLIDPERADREWAANTDPSQVRPLERLREEPESDLFPGLSAEALAVVLAIAAGMGSVMQAVAPQVAAESDPGRVDELLLVAIDQGFDVASERWRRARRAGATE